jgi:hypothetical protein
MLLPPLCSYITFRSLQKRLRNVLLLALDKQVHLMTPLSVAAELEYKLGKDPLLFNSIFVLAITAHNRQS